MQAKLECSGHSASDRNPEEARTPQPKDLTESKKRKGIIIVVALIPGFTTVFVDDEPQCLPRPSDHIRCGSAEGKLSRHSADLKDITV